jgi:hypothetical protein
MRVRKKVPLCSADSYCHIKAVKASVYEVRELTIKELLSQSNFAVIISLLILFGAGRLRCIFFYKNVSFGPESEDSGQRLYY